MRRPTSGPQVDEDPALDESPHQAGKEHHLAIATKTIATIKPLRSSAYGPARKAALYVFSIVARSATTVAT